MDAGSTARAAPRAAAPSAANAKVARALAPRDVLAITFDDAYRDVWLRVRPILTRLGLPATVFVPTGFIGSPEPLLHDRLYALLVRARAARGGFPAASLPAHLRLAVERAERTMRAGGRVGAVLALDELIASLPAEALRRIAVTLEDRLGGTATLDEGGRVMSAAELWECSEAGIELGAHTVEHMVLVGEPPSRVRRELLDPRRELEAIAARPCTSFAYCNGIWSPALVEALRAAGYRVAVTTTDRPNRGDADPLLLGRKVLWEGHTRGSDGRFSPALATAHLHDLFGALALSSPASGPSARETEVEAWPRPA